MNAGRTNACGTNDVQCRRKSKFLAQNHEVSSLNKKLTGSKRIGRVDSNNCATTHSNHKIPQRQIQQHTRTQTTEHNITKDNRQLTTSHERQTKHNEQRRATHDVTRLHTTNAHAHVYVSENVHVCVHVYVCDLPQWLHVFASCSCFAHFYSFQATSLLDLQIHLYIFSNKCSRDSSRTPQLHVIELRTHQKFESFKKIRNDENRIRIY